MLRNRLANVIAPAMAKAMAKAMANRVANGSQTDRTSTGTGTGTVLLPQHCLWSLPVQFYFQSKVSRREANWIGAKR